MPKSLQELRSALEMFTSAGDAEGYRQSMALPNWAGRRGLLAITLAKSLHTNGVEDAGELAAVIVDAIEFRASGWTPAHIDRILAA